jgi:hypothetical protein
MPKQQRHQLQQVQIVGFTPSWTNALLARLQELRLTGYLYEKAGTQGCIRLSSAGYAIVAHLWSQVYLTEMEYGPGWVTREGDIDEIVVPLIAAALELIDISSAAMTVSK